MRSELVVAGFWLMVVGCGTSQAPERKSDPTPASESARTEPAEPAEPARAEPAEVAPTAKPTCDRSKIETCFGKLELVAGLGKIRRRAENGWQASFEGGKASDAELSRPHFAMADTAGNIYVADKDAHAIRRIDTKGIITTAAGTGVAGDSGDKAIAATKAKLSRPNGVWVQPDGTFFILDLGNGKVRRVGSDGQMTTVFTAKGGIAIGRGLWVNAAGDHVYVASGRRILEWKDGKVRTAAAGFRSLGNIAVDPDGKLVASDRSAGRVYRIDGTTKTIIAGSGGSGDAKDGDSALEAPLPGVRAVWFDDSGGMFLGTHESSRLWYVGSDGRLQRMYPEEPIDEVRGLSLDSAGRLIVVDNDHGFIRVAAPVK